MTEAVFMFYEYAHNRFFKLSHIEAITLRGNRIIGINLLNGDFLTFQTDLDQVAFVDMAANQLPIIPFSTNTYINLANISQVYFNVGSKYWVAVGHSNKLYIADSTFKTDIREILR